MGAGRSSDRWFKLESPAQAKRGLAWGALRDGSIAGPIWRLQERPQLSNVLHVLEFHHLRDEFLGICHAEHGSHQLVRLGDHVVGSHWVLWRAPHVFNAVG